eukprot:COSAG06_NODE_16676_length_987_cov_1.963964_1_plen_155_part_10
MRHPKRGTAADGYNSAYAQVAHTDGDVDEDELEKARAHDPLERDSVNRPRNQSFHHLQEARVADVITHDVADLDSGEHCCGLGTVEPDNRSRLCWDGLILLTVVYTVALVPARLCFYEVSRSDLDDPTKALRTAAIPAAAGAAAERGQRAAGRLR